jgi:hypothetical protein
MTAPAPARYVDPIERLAILLWVRLPRAVIRRLPSLWGVAGDGHFLVAVAPLAVLAPFAVAAGSFVVGAQHLGYETVYTESVLLMAVAIAVGTLSSQLGLLAILGFALGEQLATRTGTLLGTGARTGGPFGEGVLGPFWRVRLPMIITYLLLAVAVVVIPRTARALLVAVGRWRRVPASIAWPLASGLFVVVVFVALRTWVAAAPTLVRPRFTWTGGLPPVDAIRPIQQDGDELIAAGVMAAMARQVLLGLALWWPPVRDRVRTAEQDRVPERVSGRAGAGARPVAPGRFRRLLGDLGSAGLATIVLAGVLEEGWLWVAAFGTFLGVRLLRSGIVAAGALDSWKRLMARVPAVARVVLLWIVARVVTDALVKGFIGSYTGVALVVIGGAIVVFLIFPGTPPVTAAAAQAPPA